MGWVVGRFVGIYISKKKKKNGGMNQEDGTLVVVVGGRGGRPRSLVWITPPFFFFSSSSSSSSRVSRVCPGWFFFLFLSLRVLSFVGYHSNASLRNEAASAFCLQVVVLPRPAESGGGRRLALISISVWSCLVLRFPSSG